MLKILATKPNDFMVGSNFVRTINQTNPIHAATRLAVSYTYGSKGKYFSSVRDRSMIYVYHAEKRRPRFKKETILFGKGSKRAGEVKQKKVEKTQEGGWMIRVFGFPADRVVTVQQHSRHFEVVLK